METIAIIEDEPIFIQLIEKFLNKDGYNFITACDGIKAQGLLERTGNETKAIILDWMMPKLCGIELLKWIKKRPELKEIPVIMLTGKTKTKHIKEGIDAGAFYYLTKPIKELVLQSIVRSAINDYNNKISLMNAIKEGDDFFRLMMRGIFHFRSLTEGKRLAVKIAGAAGVPEVGIGLNELFINAVEHGNLGLGYDEKTEYINNNTWNYEINRRLDLPENKNKYVQVRLHRNSDWMTINIKDEGTGFDFRKYLEVDEERIFDNHGRGVVTAKVCLVDLHYIEPGNKVVISLPTK